jgi:excisionase family DNA binding protein
MCGVRESVALLSFAIVCACAQFSGDQREEPMAKLTQEPGTLESALERAAQRRGFSVNEFCERYPAGRSTAYEEIAAGRLRARKIGRKTIITQDDAEEWLRNLPAMTAA